MWWIDTEIQPVVFQPVFYEIPEGVHYVLFQINIVYIYKSMTKTSV